MMRRNILNYTMLCLVTILSSCSDFFNVETDDVLDHTDYIKEESEMYAGFIGITTKMQDIGDKIIYLTDTRGEMLEPTVNTSNELYSIYNYDTDLTGNPYADPAPYYEVIIACNDYLLKAYEYKEKNKISINMDHYVALVSSTLRVKAWTYLTIAKIYGKAVWFDDPMREKKDLSQFPEKDLKGIVQACIDLLDKGFDGINGKHKMTWAEWLDPETDPAKNPYRYWDYMTPEYFVLYAELCLWNGDYKKVSDLILPQMNEMFQKKTGSSTDWIRNDWKKDKYKDYWNAAAPFAYEAISAIIYNYQKNQTNSLLKHFGTERPNEYLLAPSQVGMDRLNDADFNPKGGATTDSRVQATIAKNDAGNYVIQKYRPLSNPERKAAYQDDVHIYIYRGGDLYFMLAEALNNQGHCVEAAALINQGLGGAFPNGNVNWAGFTEYWTKSKRSLPDKGIRGVYALGDRPFSFTDQKANDLAILDEMMLEFPCEGKIYPAMIRMALRYNDFDIIADRVCPKYANPEEIRAKILAGGYFINWDMKNKGN